jgi:hypothetical protein
VSQLVISDRAPAASAGSRLSHLAAIVAGITLAFAVAILALDAVFLAHGDPGAFVFSLTFVLLVTNLAIVGGLLAVRRPRNPIGWLLLAAGLPEAIGIAGAIYARADATYAMGLPLVVPAAWMGTWTVPPTIGLLVVFLPIVFPSGHLPGPRWRFFVAGVIVAMSIGVVAAATAPSPLDNIDGMANPVALPAPIGDWVQTLNVINNSMAVVAFLVAIGSLLLRFRQSVGVERQQLKWFLFVASIAAMFLALSLVLVTGPISDAAWILGLFTMAFLPIAIGIAVLRYRLYEIDRIVSRAVGYGLVTGTIAFLFIGLVLVSEAVLSPFTSSSNLAVAGSTLIVASLFQPVRRAVQGAVDRRFDRARVDGDRIAAAFGDRLRDELGLATITAETSAVVDRALHPQFTGIWLRPPADRG